MRRANAGWDNLDVLYVVFGRMQIVQKGYWCINTRYTQGSPAARCDGGGLSSWK